MDALLENRVKTLERTVVWDVGKAHAHDVRLARLNNHLEMRSDLGALLLWIDPPCLPVNDGVVNAVLDVGGGVGPVEQTLGVRLVFGEQQPRVTVSVSVPPPFAQVAVLCVDHIRCDSA